LYSRSIEKRAERGAAEEHDAENRSRQWYLMQQAECGIAFQAKEHPVFTL
jgi:hypothetical protein